MEADYELLGLDPEKHYTPVDIRKAYRKRCLTCHPDKRGSAEEFLAITEAYNKLSKLPTIRKPNDPNDPNEPNEPNDPNDPNEPYRSKTLNKASTMINLLQSYIVHLLKTNIQVPSTPPIRLNIYVSLGDVYHCLTKKVVVKVARDVNIYDSVPFYIILNKSSFNEKGYMECVFKEKGDYRKCDVIIGVSIKTEPGFNLIPEKPLDIACSIYAPLRDYLMGFTFQMPYINGKIIEIVHNLSEMSQSTLNGEYICLKGLGFTSENCNEIGNLNVHICPDLRELIIKNTNMDISLRTWLALVQPNSTPYLLTKDT